MHIQTFSAPPASTPLISPQEQKFITAHTISNEEFRKVGLNPRAWDKLSNNRMTDTKPANTFIVGDYNTKILPALQNSEVIFEILYSMCNIISYNSTNFIKLSSYLKQFQNQNLPRIQQKFIIKLYAFHKVVNTQPRNLH